MNLTSLKNMDPWQWPENADETILTVLRNSRADKVERLLATELAGEITVINDELSEQLLAILRNGKETEEMRCNAAIALGPVLEYTDTMADDSGISELEEVEILISEDTFRKIRETLRGLFMDTGLPKELRRRILETSVRAPEDWHNEAVHKAYSGSDQDWKLTAVFCMRYVPDFEKEIMESLTSRNPDIHYEAVCSAGEWGIEEAWPHIKSLLTNQGTDKYLLLAAIDAIAGIRPEDAQALLGDFLDSSDQDIADAASEAISMAEELAGEDDDEYFDDYDDYADDYEDDEDDDDRW